MIREYKADMRGYTTFRAGGTVRELITCDTREELAEQLSAAGIGENGERPFLILGNGSNTLFADDEYPGTVIRLGKDFEGIRIEGAEMICGAAALLSAAARQAAAAGLAGLAPLSGIPGSIGGALSMNAGAYGGEMKDVVQSAEIMDWRTGEIRTIPVAEMDLSYRHSIFQGTGDIILSVRFLLEKGDREQIEADMKEFARKRNEKQPVQYPSAGSFFKRPEGYFAGKLIQDAGLKGLAVGGAQVSELHSGFIINRGGATAADILQLMHLVQNTVYDQFGVTLEPEVRIIQKESGDPE